jgi:hypothetical protein
MYLQAKTDLLNGNLDWVADDIRAVLVDAADYTPNLTADTHLDDVPAGARVATSGAMTGKTAAAGVADAADVTFAAVSGDQAEGVLLYKHTGSEATSTLILWLDTGVTGLPVTPDGDDITVRWDAAGIISLA